MQREIKFRLWDGIQMHLPDESTDEDFYISADGTPMMLLETGIKSQREPATLHSRCVVMQYVGLKDVNGIEIFEADVVNITTTGLTWGNEYTYKGYVVFDKGRFVVSCHDGKKDGYIMMAPDRPIEVIGNTCQHPHLFK